MRIAFLISILILGSFICKSQEDSIDYIRPNNYSRTDLAIITGFQIQRNQFAEIGFGVKKNAIVGHHPHTFIYGLSHEFKLNDLNNNFVVGTKALLWLASGLDIGLNLVHYTDFESSTLRFRPEYGIGLDAFKIVYGYNFAITNKYFGGINKHNFTLNIILNAKKIKEVDP